MQIIEVEAKLEKCPRPGLYAVYPLVDGEHIGSAENVRRQKLNTLSLTDAVEERDAVIDCYEAQAGK